MSLSDATFELHVFSPSSTSAGLLARFPTIRRALFVDGIPKKFIGRRYSVDSTPVLYERGDGELVLRFGTTGLDGAIGVELETGHVVEVTQWPASSLLFVNSSIEQFTETVKAVLHRFPYYDSDADDETYQRTAGELLAIIRDIDSEGAVSDRYWSTFVEDVEIGDLTTSNILSIDR